MLKNIISATVVVLNCSILFSSNVYTVKDLESTRELICEECKGEKDSRRLELNPEDQYVFGLVKKLRDRYPLSEVQSYKTEIFLCEEKIKSKEIDIIKFKEEKDNYQKEIDLLIQNSERDQKEIDILIEKRNSCQGSIDLCKDKIKKNQNMIAKIIEKNNEYKDHESNNKNYIFFPSSITYVSDRHNHNPESYRLDIQGEKTTEKKYVRLQLQNHRDQNNSYASILAQTDFPIHVNLLYFALNLAVYKYTTVTLLKELNSSVKLISFIGVGAEKMKKFEDGKATVQPQDLYLDDPIFTAYRNKIKKHLEEKNQDTTKIIDAAVEQKRKMREKIAQYFIDRE